MYYVDHRQSFEPHLRVVAVACCWLNAELVSSSRVNWFLRMLGFGIASLLLAR